MTMGHAPVPLSMLTSMVPPMVPMLLLPPKTWLMVPPVTVTLVLPATLAAMGEGVASLSPWPPPKTEPLMVPPSMVTEVAGTSAALPPP